MHNQPTMSPTCSPAVALPAQNVNITTPEADAGGAAAFRAAIPVADGAVSPAATSPRQKTIGLPIKLHQLLKSAAEDREYRIYVDPDLEGKSQAQGLIISGMLKGYGAHFDENGNYQWSKDPAHNRFERERAELNAEHSKALVSLQGQLSANKSELATTKSELSSAKEEAGKLAAARSPAAQKVQEATAAAAASAAEAKAATAAAVAANGRASRAEKALDAMAKELADSRQALEGVGSRVEQQAQLRGMRIELEHARQKVKEHQSLHISDSKKIAKLTSQAAAEQVQQERAAGTPRQLDTANAARESALCRAKATGV